MGLEMVSESWFSNLWWNSWKGAAETDKALIGALSFEVAGLMSRVVNLWHYLSDKEIRRLRTDIVNSFGIKKLVADDDDDYRMDLALNEIIENFGVISRSVARLGRKCIDHLFTRFEHYINNPVENYLEWFGWEYRLKKMERKVKKMERFVAVTMQLSQELEVLEELEQTLRRLQANAEIDRVKLLEFRQKVMWQRQEVRNLKEMSPWTRTYDYIVRLLARSLLTILVRIKHVFEMNQLPNPDYLSRTHSFSAHMQSSVHPSEFSLCVFSSGPLGRSGSKSAPSEKNKIKNKQGEHLSQLFASHGKHSHLKTKQLSPAGPFKGRMQGGSDSSIPESYRPTVSSSKSFTGDCMKNGGKMDSTNIRSLSCSSKIYSKLALFNSKHGLLSAPSCTLGDAALALHYSNLIVLIEKLASSPHMVDSETRDDLYNMLPKTIRAALRVRLKGPVKSLASSEYDTSLAANWSAKITEILEWLSPLAHNMIRWQSDRNFEREQEFSRTNVLLVQTLYFANQEKSEAAILELLVGLNYVCRISREVNGKSLAEFSSFGARYGCMRKEDDYCI